MRRARGSRHRGRLRRGAPLQRQFRRDARAASVVPPLAGESAERFARAVAELGEPQAFDADQALTLVSEAAGRSEAVASPRTKTSRSMNATEEPIMEEPEESGFDSDWEAEEPRRRRRRNARRRRRGLRRSARPAARHGAHAEGRSRQDLDPRARPAISRLHRRGAAAEARDRRRLSRHGGLARLPQIEAAAAVGGDATRASRAARSWRSCSPSG